jgi:hypothetical protein
MQMRNHYIFLIIGLFAAHVSHGQITLRVISMDTLVSEVRPADFHPMSPVVDSNANVVILRDTLFLWYMIYLSTDSIRDGSLN